MKSKYIITGGKYEASRGMFVFYPNKFWVSYNSGETQLYIGKDEGGGNYYDLKGNHKKKIMQIVELLEDKSAWSLLVLFNKLNKNIKLKEEKKKKIKQFKNLSFNKQLNKKGRELRKKILSY
jgi:hypothetical protein